MEVEGALANAGVQGNSLYAKRIQLLGSLAWVFNLDELCTKKWIIYAIIVESKGRQATEHP